MSRGMALIAALALVTGCAGPLSVPGAGATAFLDVAARIAPLGTRVQALVEPYSVADVDHLVVKVFTIEGTAEKEVLGENQAPVALTIGNASLSVPVRFRNLHLDTTYRVRGYAFKGPAAVSPEQISVDGSSYLDIKLTNDDEPTIATLSIQLKARSFSGQATSSLDIKAGGVTDAGGEAMAKRNPS